MNMELIIAVETLVIIVLLYRIHQNNRILESVKNEAAIATENAKNEAAVIIDNAKQEAKSEADKLIADGQKQASDIIAEASAANKRLLDKNAALEKYLAKYTQDEEKYFELRNSVNEQIYNISNNNRTINKQKDDIKLYKGEIKRAKEVLQNYFYDNHSEKVCLNFLNNALIELENLQPTIEVQLKALEYEDLKKLVKENRKKIKSVLKKYESRYTTKQNRSIYQLMVIALQAELQNIVFNLRYSNYEKSIGSVNDIIKKYLSIATDGNQTIHPTMVKFIGEIEILFKKAVNLEYDYYVRQENIKEEQRTLREQLKQEAREMKALQEEQEKLLREENKYKLEIEENKKKLETEKDSEQIILLENRISELESQLTSLNDKKEQIINLQHGKAGYVYIISNVGSFGDNVFKIGMTRRLDPQDRVNELGSASVPFKFDVHSFIFSEDAVSLENKLHQELDAKRVNKINLRKEFFNCTIDEIESIVRRIQPTASFIRTKLAEQYHQTLSLEKQQLELVEE